MKIKIGNNAKINNSIIGNNNNSKTKDNVLITVLITIICGIIIAGIVYYLGWN